MLSQQLKIYSREQVLAYTNLRRFETKIGEVVQTAAATDSAETAVQQTDARFVIIGVPEYIGIKANEGTGGGSAWNFFLSSFLNIQSNDFFDGSNILLLGHLNFAGIAEVIESNTSNKQERIDAYRHSVTRIDEAVEDVVKMITANGKIPVVVSGGHHNAYGCIKGAAKGWYKQGEIPIAQINVINLDADAGYKPLEGRHSANAIRYADEDGYLEKYCVIGLHENNLTQNSWLDIANNPFFDFITYEDIFVHGKQSFTDAVHHAINFTGNELCGIELNLSAVQQPDASAVGISALQARQFIHIASSNTKPAYLHIAEAYNRTADKYDAEAAGKLIGYVVSDFIKAMNY